MPRVGFPLLRGSTLLIPRTIWTSSSQYLLKTKQITVSQIAIKSSTTAQLSVPNKINDLGSASYSCRHGSWPFSSGAPLSLADQGLDLGEGGKRKSFLSRALLPQFLQALRCYTSDAVKSQVWTALKMQKVLVIGISGITNGGKTTLCELLEKDLPMAKHINMDDYFYVADSGHIPFVEEVNHGNYEDVRAIDFDRMVEDVDNWVKAAADQPIKGHPQILFLEGILIFNHLPLVKYYSRKYFLTLTKEQCWERRKHRTYDPPDPPNYFELIVWPMYLENKASISDQKDIVYLDGMVSTDKTYRRILTDIKNMIEG